MCKHMVHNDCLEKKIDTQLDCYIFSWQIWHYNELIIWSLNVFDNRFK